MKEDKNLLLIVAGAHNNKKLAEKFEMYWKKITQGKTTTLNLLDIPWPLFDPRKEEDMENSVIRPIYDLFLQHSKIAFFSPEYNGGVPPVLTNVLAWLSRMEANWQAAFKGKKALVATHSGGKGALLIRSLKDQLQHIGMDVLSDEVSSRVSDKNLDLHLEQAAKKLAQ